MPYDYSAWQWILVFFLYCFLGWCFESTVVSVQQRHFVNRGFLRGPMLPIYGFGATILLHVSLPLYDKPAALFLASMVAATAFEYVVGVIMEKLFKVKYWDYSEHRFQFQGRICLQSSLCWGFLGLILARVIHPPVEWIVAGLPFAALVIVDILLTAAFASDVAVSVRTALDLARLLEELDELRAQGAELRQQLSESALVRLTNLSYRVDEARGELSEKVADAKERLDDVRAQTGGAYDQMAETAKVRLTNLSYRVDEARGEWAEKMGDAREQLADAKEQILAQLDELHRRFSDRANGLGRTRKSMLRGNPTARSAEYDDVLQRLKKPGKDELRLLLKTVPDRIHTIIPGLLALDTIAKAYGAQTITASACGVREGYLLARVLGEPLEDQSKITPST